MYKRAKIFICGDRTYVYCFISEMLYGRGRGRATWTDSIVPCSQKNSGSFELDLEGMDGCSLLEEWKGRSLEAQSTALSLRIYTEVVCRRALLFCGLGSWFSIKK